MKKIKHMLNVRTLSFALTSSLLLVILSFSSVYATGTSDELNVLQKTSKAFTHIAKKAIPAVVFIKVEKTVDAGRQLESYKFNNPYDLFSDEFFKRFFGQRYPHMRKPRQHKQMGSGSGFIISQGGYILTNNHVVGDADKITVILSDGKEYQAEKVGTDPRSDVALIKVKGAGKMPVLPMGDSDQLEVGELVMAIGNPFGLSHTMTVGVVSAKGRTGVGITDYEDFIQTDAAINPGNSGGPLINMKGEVIGINTAIFSKSGGYMGIGFAIPVNMVKAINKQLIAKGTVTRGHLGVAVQKISKDLMQSFGLKGMNGVLIADVTAGSPADKAGIKRGDVVLEYDGKKVKDVGQFRNLVALSEPGAPIKMVVIRNENKVGLEVKPGTLGEAITKVNQTEVMKKLGFTFQDLNKELAMQLGYEKEGGVVVSQVMPVSPAQFAGLRPGMLILEVNREEVKNSQDFLKEIEKSIENKKVLFLIQHGRSTQYVILQFG